MRKVGGGGAQRAAAVGGARCRCCPARLGSARLRAARRGLARIPPGSGTAAGLSRFPSSRRRDWGCPVPFPAQGGFGAVPIPIPPPEGPELPPTPHTHLFAAPLCCAGPRAPTFFLGGGGGVQPPMGTKGFGRCHHFCWSSLGEVQVASGSATSSRLCSPPYEALPPAANPSLCRLAFFLSSFVGLFFLPLSHTFFIFSFSFPKDFFPHWDSFTLKLFQILQGMFWMLT